MVYYLKTFWVWLKRCAYSRGFGVQSPSAYRFIRYIINEHYPYYAYEEFKQSMQGLDKCTHKLGRLMFRLANFWQPISVYSYKSVYGEFIKAGCRDTVLKRMEECLERNHKDRLLVILPVDAKEQLEALLSVADEQVLLVLEGKLDNRDRKQVWNLLKEDGRVGITYDLYYCRIVFFDRSIYKQHYQVNF